MSEEQKPKKERWLISYAQELQGLQVLRNMVIEKDPITWLMQQNETRIHPPVVLVSCFFLEMSDEMFREVKNVI